MSVTHFFAGASFLIDTTAEGITTDLRGHGTHVAGIAASKTYGVAKKAKIFSVKGLDSSGYGVISEALEAIAFVVNDVQDRQADGTCPNGFVANLSWGGLQSNALNTAVSNCSHDQEISSLTIG